jgi:hypothetical protein
MQIDFLWQLCQENRLFLLATEIIKLLVKNFFRKYKKWFRNCKKYFNYGGLA